MAQKQKIATAFPYHPIFAKMMRSDSVPALLLSYVYAQAKAQSDPTGEMALPKRFLAVEIGISLFKVERARRRLVDFTIYQNGQQEWVWRESIRTMGKLKTQQLYICLNVPVIDYLLGKYYA